MSDVPHDVTRYPDGKGPPGSQELASVIDLMRAMVRSAKGLRIYLPNNPVLIRFNEELHSRLVLHLARYGEMRLDVEPFALRYKGAEVYRNRDPRESFSFRMRTDGIMAVMIGQGVGQEELTDFLGVIGLDHPSFLDDDIVTRLWEMSLPHISCLLEADLVELDLEVEQHPKPCQQEAISAMRAAMTECYHPPPLMLPKHLLMLTGEEAEWLRRARESEAVRDPVDDVTHILLAVLGGTEDHAIFSEFVSIATRLASDLLLSGEMRRALRLVRYLRQLTTLGSLSADQRRLLVDSIGGILSAEAVRSLQEALDEGEPLTRDELREFLQLLGLPALGGICELLGSIKKLKMRKVILEALVELGKDDPQVFAGFLDDGRWYLVRNMVLILSMLQTPAALEMIVRLISHREPRVRKEVLSYLESSGDPRARSYLLKFLRDDSAPLRIKALQILVREKHPFALKPAVTMATAPDFPVRTLAEKRAICEAIGALGSEAEIPVFREMLIKKRWFMKGVEKEAAACAVAGLVQMKSKAALELLEEARKQRNPELKDILEQAIAAIGAADDDGATRRLRWLSSRQTG